VLSEIENKWQELEQGIDLDDRALSDCDGEVGDDDEGCRDEDDVDGWVDEREEMSDHEKIELEKSIQPMRLILTKVSTRDAQIRRKTLT